MISLGEEIENSFAVGEDGVYIVSDQRMYRFRANRAGRPRIVWSSGYPNSGIEKPSQVNAGSGTTPTLMTGGYVAITDNADPMNVVVFRTARRLHGERRKVCTQPVFGARRKRDRELADHRRALADRREQLRLSEPVRADDRRAHRARLARVDLDRDGEGCRLRWTNTDARAPSVVPKLSTKTGLIYAYTRPPDPVAEGITGPRSTGAVAAPSGAATPGRACPTTTTTPGWPSAPTAPPTSASPAGWSPCATAAEPPQGARRGVRDTAPRG